MLISMPMAHPAEKVHLFAANRNHAPMYESIRAAETLLGNQVHVRWMFAEGNRGRGLLREMIEIIRSPEPVQRLYLEEFLELRDILFVYAVALCFSKIHLSLCIHSLNKWFFLEYRPGLKRVAMYLARTMLLGRVKEIIVVSPAMKKYGENVSRFQKSFRVMAFRQPTPEKVMHIDSSPRLLTIPGGIDEKRKDYFTVIDACRLLANDGKDFRLVFLGRFRRELVSDRLAGLVEDFSRDFPGKLVTFDNYVTDELFEGYVAASTCLIANLVPYYHGDEGTAELYGVSKETGVRSLADCHDKVCLTPNEIPPGERKQNYIQYDSVESLYAVLDTLIANAR